MARKRRRDLHEAQVPGAPEGLLRGDVKGREANRGVTRDRSTL